MDLLKTARDVRKMGEVGHRDSVVIGRGFRNWAKKNDAPLSRESLSSWLGSAYSPEEVDEVWTEVQEGGL